MKNSPSRNFISLDKYSGYLSQRLVTKKGTMIHLKFSVMYSCERQPCIATTLSVRAEPTLLLNYTDDTDRMNIWHRQTVGFLAPSDSFILSFQTSVPLGSDARKMCSVVLDDVTATASM